MTTPSKILTFNEANFRSLLNQHTFANSGDKSEQTYSTLIQADFPRNEEFWRQFVVPLTNRIDSARSGKSIDFRAGVDERLQYICGANYSLFVHLALAEHILKNWNDTSLDSIYARLGSAFDVFEALAIQFHFLISECRGIKSPLVEELKQSEFLDLAKDYYDKHYSNLHKYYITIGKNVPPIRIPARDSVVEEFFKGHDRINAYLNTSREIRTFRNAIVHDVRLGMLLNVAGEFMIPKSSRVQDYRQWSKVLAVVGDGAKIKRDFCEVKTQCSEEIARSIQIINELYDFILQQFQDEFYSSSRPSLRDYFGIKFDTAGGGLTVYLPGPQPYKSASFETSYPGTSGTGLGSGTINISGVRDITPRPSDL